MFSVYKYSLYYHLIQLCRMLVSWPSSVNDCFLFLFHKTNNKGWCFALLLVIVAFGCRVWLWHKRGSRRRASLVLMGILVLRKRGGSSIWKGEYFFFEYCCWVVNYDWDCRSNAEIWIYNEFCLVVFWWICFAKIVFVRFLNFVGFVLILAWDCSWVWFVHYYTSIKLRGRVWRWGKP